MFFFPILCNFLFQMTLLRKLFYACLCVVLVLAVSACSSHQNKFALQSTALVLNNVAARPEQVNPGGTVILDIALASISEHLREGKIIVTDPLGNAYEESVSNLKRALNTSLVSSFRLSPLVPSGEMLLQVFVLDSEGNSSNTGFVKITVL